MDKDKQLVALKRGFDELADLFVALGDETRQHLIMTLFNLPCKQQGGARVGEITAKTHLSRPAVSHHLKILHFAGKFTDCQSQSERLPGNLFHRRTRGLMGLS